MISYPSRARRSRSDHRTSGSSSTTRIDALAMKYSAAWEIFPANLLKSAGSPAIEQVPDRFLALAWHTDAIEPIVAAPAVASAYRRAAHGHHLRARSRHA